MVTNKLLQSDSYPDQAHVGWFYACFINALKNNLDQDKILKNSLNKIWNDLTQKDSNSRFSDLFNPAALNILNENSKNILLSELQTYLDDLLITDKKGAARVVIDTHTQEGSHLGIYCFDDERTIFAQRMLDHPGTKRLVETYKKDFNHWHTLNFFSNLLKQGTEKQKTALARAIHDKITPKKLIRMSTRMLKDCDMAFALIFNTSLISALPEEEKNIYATDLLDATKQNIVRVFADLSPSPHSKGFIEALPKDLGIALTQFTAFTALNMDLSGANKDYGSEQGYWYRARFTNAVYSYIPETYQPHFEQVVLKNLQHATDENYEDMLLKTAVLLRNPLTASGDVQTQEMNLYQSRHPTASATARIHPTRHPIGRRGLVAVNSFIGTLEDFSDQITGKYKLEGAPRDKPPNQHEIFPIENHKPLIKLINRDKKTHKQQPFIENILEVRIPNNLLPLSSHLLIKSNKLEPQLYNHINLD